MYGTSTSFSGEIMRALIVKKFNEALEQCDVDLSTKIFQMTWFTRKRVRFSRVRYHDHIIGGGVGF